MNILVVDDEKNIAYAIAQILEEQKWQVTMAYDGQEGLDLALSGYYDVAILDIMLPVMNGFEYRKCVPIRLKHQLCCCRHWMKFQIK